MTGTSMDGRSWITAAGYRALGHHVPDDVDDNEVILAIPASPSATPKPTSWWRRRKAARA